MTDHADIDHAGVTGVPAAAADLTFDPTGLDNTAATDVQAAMADFDAAITAGGGGGGAPSSDRISTSEALSGNNSWVDLATPGPAVTVAVGPQGVARVTLTASIGCSSPNYAGMGCIMSGNNTLAGDLNRCLLVGDRNADDQYSFTTLYTGLTPGPTTFTAKYNQFGSGGTATWKNREIIVETW